MGWYLFSVVELVALRRVAPRPAAQRLPANRADRASRSAAARGGVVAARQPLPLNRYLPRGEGEFVNRLSITPVTAFVQPPYAKHQADACCSLSLRECMCLAPKPRVGQGRGIYPAGTPPLQIHVGEFQGHFATQPSCRLKSALRSLAQRPR